MSSKRASEAGWSLTGRMAAIFAATMSALLLLYAAWSALFVFTTMRDDLKAFLDHETQELRLGIGQSDGSHEAVRDLAQNIATVSQPDCGFRVRNLDGTIVAEAGDGAVLAAVREPIEPGSSWRRYLFTDGLATAAVLDTTHGLVIEVLADTSESLQAMKRYATWALVAFGVSVLLAAFAGWFTAHRGLRGLRQVVERVRSVQLPAPEGWRIRLEDAPREVREVGSALNAMIARVDDGMRRMRTFTAGLAHELRSPLQNLIGETEVALLSDRQPLEYQRLLKSNLEDLADLSDAIDNLVAFCRTAEPQASKGKRESFDLAAEARLRLEREQRSAKRAGVTVEVTSEGDTRLHADREGCLRLVRNLVGNAIHWSPPGTRVAVRLQGENGRLKLVVEDQGPGVPPELGQRIFDAFVSGRRAGGRGRSGYGLGLAICRSVITDHGGSLGYENLPAGGTRFVAEIPRGGPAAA